MGTNYYAVRVAPCVFNRVIHLGKQSHGWRFLFQGNNEIHSYNDFLFWLDNNVDTGDYVLMDEYNQSIQKSQLIDIIQANQNNENANNFRYCQNVDGYRFDYTEFS